MNKVVIYILLFSISLAFISGCEKKQNVNSDVLESKITNVYRKEQVNISDDYIISSDNGIQIVDGYAYLIGYEIINKDTYERQYKLCALNIENKNVEYSDINLNEVEASIIKICVCSDNSYIILESAYDTISSKVKYILKKMNKQGETVLSIDVGDIFTDINEITGTPIISIDYNDNIYLAINNEIAILNKNGDIIYKLECGIQINLLGSSSNKNIFVLYYDENNINRMVYIADDGTVSDSLQFPDGYTTTGNNKYYFGNGYDIFIGNESNVMGYNVNIANSQDNILMNWVNSDLSPSYIQNMTAISKDEFIMYGRDVITNKSGLYILTRVPDNEIQSEIVINLTYIEDGTNNIPIAVIKFNNQNEKYRIVTNEYSSSGIDIDYQALITRINTDIVTGNIGDIIIMDTVNYPIESYCEKKVFCDLYKLMDADDKFSREMLFECVRTPFETKGELNILIPNFTFGTIAGKIKNVGDASGWSIAEMLAFENTLTDNVVLLKDTTKQSMLEYLITTGIGGFINYETGICNFNGEKFIDILKYANTFPETVDNTTSDKPDIINYINDKVILKQVELGSFNQYLMLKALFGFNNGINFIGYPTESGNGAIVYPTEYYAINAKSVKKEGAWEFLKYLISEDNVIDENKGMRYFPSLVSAFDRWTESEMKMYYYFYENSTEYINDISPIDTSQMDIPGTAIRLDDKDIEFIKKYLNSLNKKCITDPQIISLITEDVTSYFYGEKTAEEAAKIIQSRVTVYINEKR